jgi:hypothetical protein
MIQTGGLIAKEQKWGDCFAHASTTVIIKLLKKLGIVPDVRDLTGKNEQYKADLNLLDSLEQQYIDCAIETAYASNQRMKIDAEYETIQYLIDNEIKRIRLLVYRYDLTNPENQRSFGFEKMKLEEIKNEISHEKSNLDLLAEYKSTPDYKRQEEIVNKLIKTSEYMSQGLKILNDNSYDDIDKREEFYKTIKKTFAKMTKILDDDGLQEFRQMKTKMLDDAKKMASDEIQRLNDLIAEYEKKLKMDEDDKKRLEEMKLELERQTSESKQLDIETKINNDKIDAEEKSKIEIDGLKKKIDAIESGEDEQKIELLNELRTSLKEELEKVSDPESSSEESRVRERDLNEFVQYLDTKINAIDTKNQDLSLINDQDKTPDLHSYDDVKPHEISTDFITTTTITPPISQKNTDEIEDTSSQVLTKDQTQDSLQNPQSNDSTIITPTSNTEGLNIEEQRQNPLQGMTQDPQSVDKNDSLEELSEKKVESSNIPSQDTTSTQQSPSTPNIPSQTVPPQQTLKTEEVKTDQNSKPNQQSQVENEEQLDESSNVPSSNNIPSSDDPSTNLKQDLQDQAKTAIDAIYDIKRAKDEFALSQSIETKAVTPEAIAKSKQDVQDKQETLAKSMNKGSELINQDLDANENIDDLYIKLIQSLIDYLITLLKKHETFDNLQKSQSSNTPQSGGRTPEEISRLNEELKKRRIAKKAELERNSEIKSVLDTQKLKQIIEDSENKAKLDQIREDAENKARLDVLKRIHDDEYEKRRIEIDNKEMEAKKRLNDAILIKAKEKAVKEKEKAELVGIRNDNEKWLSFLIDTYNLFFRNLNTRSKIREGKFNEIEKKRNEIVGEINDDGEIKKEGRNKQLSDIIAMQTLYYRQIHLYIVQTCGINGGSQGVIFDWLCTYVNTGEKPEELCEGTRPDCNDGCTYNENFDKDVKRLNNDTFFTENVVEKIRSVLQPQKKKLQFTNIYRTNNFNIVTIDKYNMEKPNEISDQTFLKLDEIADRNIYLRNARKIIQKGLYVSLSIKVNDEFNKELYDFDTPEHRPVDHAVTITNITDDLITIKNSWGITFGEFGKIYVPFMKFDNRFRHFDIEYIDIVDHVDDVKKRGGNSLLRKTRKKNCQSTASVKKRKTKKSI